MVKIFQGVFFLLWFFSGWLRFGSSHVTYTIITRVVYIILSQKSSYGFSMIRPPCGILSFHMGSGGGSSTSGSIWTRARVQAEPARL